MYQFLKRLLRIHDGEEKKVLQFAALGGLVQAGLAIGISASDSLFLVNVGSEKLPIVYLILPAIMLAYIPLYAYLMGRFGIERLFKITLLLIAIGGVLLYYLLDRTGGDGRSGASVFYVVKIYCGLWFIALYTLVWNFIDGYFDIQDAKRLFSFLSGGMALGTIVGGALVPVLLVHLNVKQLMLIWSGLAMATIPLLRTILSSWERIASESGDFDDERISLVGQIGLIVGAFRSSKYAVFMVLASLSTLMVTTVCEFQYMRVFEQGRTAEEVAALFGRLYAMVNCLGLVINLFVFNRLVFRIGVRNTALIQPIVYAAVFSYLLLDFGFGAAVAGFVAYQGILTSIDYNNQNFLFNALPTRGKAVLRTFIEGICEPLATALVGVSLYFFAHELSPESISVAGLGGVVIAIAAVFGLRSHYTSAIVRNLKETWLDFSAPNPQSLSGLSETDVQRAVEAARSDNPHVSVTAIRIIWMNDRAMGLGELLRFIERRPPAEHAAAARLLSDILSTRDPDLFRQIVAWFSRVETALSPSVLEVFGGFHILGAAATESLLKSPEPRQRAAAVIALLSSRRLDVNLAGLERTEQMLASKETERAAAVRILGKSGQRRYAAHLAAYLCDSSETVRKEALVAISTLADESSESIVAPVLEAMRFGDHDLRVLGFETLAKIRSTGAIRRLIENGTDYTSDEMRRAEAVIHRIGLEGVPILTALLKSRNQPLCNRGMTWRALSRLAFPQFEASASELISDLLARAYGCVFGQQVLSSREVGDDSEENDAVAFLSAYYRYADTAFVDAVLEILTIGGRLFNYEQMASSLQSNNPKERGNAIETIEQACPHDIFNRLSPLLLSISVEEKTALCRVRSAASLPSLSSVLISAMESREPLEAAIGFTAGWFYLEHAHGPSELTTERLLAAMKNRLDAPPDAVLDATIFSLLGRMDRAIAEREEGEVVEMNVVEKAAMLSRAEFFQLLPPPALLEIANIASISTLGAGEAVAEAQTDKAPVYIVVNGEVEDETVPSSPFIATDTYPLIGAARLFGREIDSRTLRGVSNTNTICSIPRRSIDQAMEKYPKVGTMLYAYKLGVHPKTGIGTESLR